MRYLVTGGAGFIGSNLVEELLTRGDRVRVLDNFSTGKRENLKTFKGDVELIEGDIRSYHVVQQAVAGVDVVLHQAALPSVPRSISDPITTNEVNVVGTLNILEASRESKVKRVVYASSSSVYGDSAVSPKNERMIPRPLSPYAVSKLAAEKYCGVFSRIYGLETIALRYFNVFGPRQDPNSQYSAVIPKFIGLIHDGCTPTIYGDGLQSRDFTFIANVVNANMLAATADYETGLVLNCACGSALTLNDVVESIGRVMGRSVEPEFAPERPGDVKHSLADIGLAKQTIGYEPTVDFIDGLAKTIDAFNPGS